MSLICHLTSEDIKHHFIIRSGYAELRSFVKIEVAVLSSPSLMVFMVSVDVTCYTELNPGYAKQAKNREEV